MMAERMTFRTTRGRTIESERAKWLRRIRTERQEKAHGLLVVVGGFWEYTAPTLRRAKILGMGIAYEYKFRHPEKMLNVEIYDRWLRIKIWEN